MSFYRMFITPANVSLNPYNHRFPTHPFRLARILMKIRRNSLKGTERELPCRG